MLLFPNCTKLSASHAVVIDAMKTSSLRIAMLVAIIAPFLVFHPTIARAATVTVMVGPGGFFFKPASVTIHTGDTVVWTWSSGGHSSTSGSPGMPSGLWDSGILNQGATFMHAFNTAGSFSYYCTVHGACCGMVGTVIVSNSTPTPTPTPTPSRLGNISTRGLVQTGNDVMIGGFIITGTVSKQVVLRGLGPTLTQFGVSGVLADPFLSLFDGNGNVLYNNDNWKDTQQAAIQATGLAPPNDLESAILRTLPPGNYTAVLTGKNGTTGVGLVEVYDLSTGTTSILGNISTRDFVQTGADMMIGGFIVQGTQSNTVIVRAIGPELTAVGVPNALADPTLELHGPAGALIASNNNWQTTIIGGIITSDQVSAIQNSGHAPTQASESAIIATLPPGNYTAIVRGVNNTVGVALVEVYDLPP